MTSARLHEEQILFVTATPPTPNGDLHLGHFSGPYLAADVFARHQRRSPGQVANVTGIDDNQTYTHTRGIKERRLPEEVAESFGDRIEQAWSDLGVDWDLVSRPNRSKYHRSMVDRLVQRLYQQGQLVARARPLPWCPTCSTWAYEAYVAGSCPHCGTAACGNACEVCGRPNDCADLRDPTCTTCGTSCELRECERLYFPLEPHRELLKSFWAQVEMNGHLRQLCDVMTEAGLPEIAVSHPGSWGVPVPIDGFETHTVYVWFEMAAGYLASAAEWAENTGAGDWRTAWCDGSVVQFFGYDNGYFHAVLFPAVMKAYDAEIAWPDAFISNEFYRLDGKKFSTSRRHAIWAQQALSVAPADHLRLYLSFDRPVAEQTSFTWPDLAAHLYGNYLPRWSSWLADAQRRFTATAQRPSATVQLPTKLSESIGMLLPALDHAYSRTGFSPRRAFLLLDLIVREAAEFGTEQEYLADAPHSAERLDAALADEAHALAVFAAGLAPLAPVMAEQLWSRLGLHGTAAEVAWQEVPALRPAWREVTGLETACPLFLAPEQGASWLPDEVPA